MRVPDYKGKSRWSAWKVDLTAGGFSTDTHTTLGLWLVHAPGVHMLWSYWWVSLIHLRPTETHPSPYLEQPGMGWEMMCFAQNPDVTPDPDRVKETFRHLTPADWTAQFGAVQNDTQALLVAEDCIETIIDGRLPPDADFRSQWRSHVPGRALHLATLPAHNA